MSKKNIATIIAATLITILTSLTMSAFWRKSEGPTESADGHELTSLWKEYDNAVSADRPRKQIEILNKIKEEAGKQRLAWDFYDAARLSVQAGCSVNWKQRDSLQKQLEKDVAQYDEPIVTFAWMCSQSFSQSYVRSLYDYVLENDKVLKSGAHKGFYSGVGFVPEFYANDYEYALWTLLPYSGRIGLLSKTLVMKTLKEYEGDSYPLGAYIDYLQAEDMPESSDSERVARREALQSVVEKYSGKGVSMYAKATLTSMKYYSLSDAADGEQFRQLYEECKAFEKERKAFKGVDAKVVKDLNSVENLSKNLVRKSISLEVRDSMAVIYLRNISTVAVKFYKKNDKEAKPLIQTTLKNPKESFYVVDTLELELPAVDDGEYILEASSSGNVTSIEEYESYRISIASRVEERGTCIYAADWKSGEPLRSADLTLTKKGKVIAEYKDFVFNGFTPLPKEILEKIDDRGYAKLSCSYRAEDGHLRQSKNINLSRDTDISSERNAKETLRAEIFTDSGAYNPGDTVHFKVVLFNTDYRTTASTEKAGVKVKVTLVNAEGREVENKVLTTNDFGSIAGEFCLPVGERGGMFSINVQLNNGKDLLCARHIRVDEFVLPTFEMTFDKLDKVYLPGDTIVVSGRVTSYSGHSLSSANASFRVTSYGSEVASGALDVRADGTFEVRFASTAESGWKYYSVEVKIVDDTGETHDYSKSLWVVGSINLNLSLKNASDGQAKISINQKDIASRTRLGGYGRYDYDDVKILSCDTAFVEMTIYSRDGRTSSLEIEYQLQDESGAILLKSTAESGSEVKIDFSGKASGLYRLMASAKAVSASGREYSDSSSLDVLLVRADDKVLDAPVQDLFVAEPSSTDDQIEALFGMADGKQVWALADLFGTDGKLIESRMLQLSGEIGTEGSLSKIQFDYKADYPEAVRLQIFYFRGGDEVFWAHEYQRPRSERTLPLEFSSFEDKTLPSSAYIFSIKTLPDVECLAAVFDKSTETIASNRWNIFKFREFHVGTIRVNANVGNVGGDYSLLLSDSVSDTGDITFYSYEEAPEMDNKLSRSPMMAYSKASGVVDMLEDAEGDFSEDAVEGESSSDADVVVRENFSNSLAFMPFLRSDASGDLSLSFSTSDKLSTYIVSLYAHDKTMRNATLRRETMVTIPIKVSVVEPKYLYDSDKYQLAAAVSSVADKDIAGALTLSLYPCGKYSQLSGAAASSGVSSPSARASETSQTIEPLMIQRKWVSVPAGGSLRELFDIDMATLSKIYAREQHASHGEMSGDKAKSEEQYRLDTLGLKVVFSADKFSDGLFVPVPVLPSQQTLSESHSAVLLAGADKEQLLQGLRSEFINVPSSEASYNEIKIIDMVREALPDKVAPQGKDVLSLSEAFYVRKLAGSLGVKMDASAEDHVSDTELITKMMACHNADGGFGWFEDMHSSPVITSVLLERFAKMSAAGLVDMDAQLPTSGDTGAASDSTLRSICSATVKYLDNSQFAAESLVPSWCGGISDEQYMYVRSMFPSVKFDVKGFTSGAQSKSSAKVVSKRIKEFQKDSKEYLVPSKERGLNGYIHGKVRRISTLRNLLGSDEGISLAKSWGLGLNVNSKLRRSVEADMVSLLEYAENHKDGGVYYPNIVMPYRGLLESEAYAHSALCDLLFDYAASTSSAKSSNSSSENAAQAQSVADGIRIWLMHQKETQKWDSDPAFVDAINSVMQGSDEVKQTSVIVLTTSYTKPFSEIKSSGNGFTIERKFFREVTKAEENTLIEDDSKETARKIVLEEIHEGDTVYVGDKITAQYKIHNDENRSFVKVTVPREASLRPVNQLSGCYGMWPSPLRVSSWYTFTPQGYRNVKSAQTEYYFDSYPEEDTMISEQFFVTQAGTFAAPVVEIESLYVPHYRANGAAMSPLSSSQYSSERK